MMPLDQVNEWPVGRVAAGYLDAAGTRHRVGPTGETFPLASVTKPLVAYAVLVAIEEGTLSPDQPAGPPGATVAHLLAHASGLGEDPLTPLGPAGQRRIYSNAGFEVLGRELEAASAMTTADYVHLALVEPLGLRATALTGSPAHGAISSVDDLLTLTAEWRSPSLVSPATMADAVTARFPDLAGVLPGFGRQEPNPWGLGFEIRGNKSPHWTGSHNSPATYGHFGRAGTFVWVDPDAAVACVALTDTLFGPWATTAWPTLSDAVLMAGANPHH